MCDLPDLGLICRLSYKIEEVLTKKPHFLTLKWGEKMSRWNKRSTEESRATKGHGANAAIAQTGKIPPRSVPGLFFSPKSSKI